MAFRNIYFPSSSSAYTTPMGDIRIRMYYNYSSELTVNDSVPLIKIHPIEIPLEVDPSDQSFRFDSFKLTFGYSSIFDDDAVIRYAPNATWMDLIIDGAVYWKGIINFDKIKKYDWQINSAGDLEWQKIDIEAYGCFAYFWWNNVTLADCGYTIGDDIETTLINICGYININSSDVVIDSNIKISVDYGTTEYDLGDLKINRYDTGRVSDFLKSFIIEFAVFTYFINGKVYFVHRNGGTTINITDGNIIEIEKGINENVIEYTSIVCKKSKQDETGEFYHPDDGQLIDPNGTWDAEFSSGTQSVDQNRNFIYQCDLLQDIYTLATGATNYPTYFDIENAIKPGSSDGVIVTDPNFVDFETALIEDGDIIFYNGGYSIYPFEEGSMVYEVTDDHTVKFFATGVAPDVDDAFTIYRGSPGETPKQPGVSRLRYKFYKLAKLAESVYADFFLNSADVLKITLYDISVWDDLSKRFVFDSENYRARKARLDILEDTIYLELIKVT